MAEDLAACVVLIAVASVTAKAAVRAVAAAVAETAVLRMQYLRFSYKHMVLSQFLEWLVHFGCIFAMACHLRLFFHGFSMVIVFFYSWGLQLTILIHF